MIQGRDRTPAEDAQRVELTARLLRRRGRSVARAWEDGRLLVKLRAVSTRGEWGATLRKLGFNPSSDFWRRRLWMVCPSAEAAGKYKSIQQAYYAHLPEPEVCPSGKGCAGDGRKRATSRECFKCAEAREAKRLEGKQADKDAAAEQARLAAEAAGGVTGKHLTRKLVAHQKLLEQTRSELAAEQAAREAAEAAVAEARERIALLERAVAAAAESFSEKDSRIPESSEPAVAAVDMAPYWVRVGADKRPVGGYKWGNGSIDPATLRDGEHLGWKPWSLGQTLFDIDRVEGKDGPVEWSDLESEGLLEAAGEPSVSYRSVSGKGMHVAFPDSVPRGNAKFRFGRLRGDIRGNAGYAVVPDSDRAALLAMAEDLPHLPKRDLSRLFPERPEPRARAVTGGATDSAWSVGALGRVRAAREGERNNTLFAIACEGFRRAMPDNWFEQLLHFSSLHAEEASRAISSARRTVTGGAS